MQNTSEYRSLRRTAFVVFLFFSFLYAFTSSGRPRTPDEYGAYFETESLVLRQSLAIPQAVTLGYYYGIPDRFGQARSPYPGAQALVASPFYYAGKISVSILKPTHLIVRLYVLAFFTTLSSAVITAATIAVLFLLLTRIGYSLRASLLTVFCVALTTMAWPYAGYFFSEPLAGLLIVLAAFTFFGREGSAETTELSWKAATVGTLLLAALPWVRVTHALAAPVFCLALMIGWKPAKWLRPVAFIAVGVGLSVGAYLLYNHHLYGDYFQFGYPEAAEGGRQLNSFTTPPQVGLVGLLFSPGKSIFIYLPMTILGVIGFKKFREHSRPLAMAAVILPVAYLLFYMTYAQWEGGRCLGPRYMLPALLLLCIGAAPLLGEPKASGRVAAWIICGIGALVQIVSMATSFLEGVMSHGYYDSALSYRLSFFHFGLQLELLWGYLTGALKQQPGLGWDRWFVFLHQIGVSTRFIAAIAIVEVLCAVACGWWIVHEFRRWGSAERQQS